MAGQPDSGGGGGTQPATVAERRGQPARPARRAADASLARGDRLGRYLVLDRLGAGGMGIVYAAYDPDLDRKVAVKLLRPAPDAAGGERGRVRLVREAQAMARLSHPNVVTVLDVGTLDDQVFVAMEFVDGVTLGGWLEERERPWREVLRVFVEAGTGLAAAHAGGLIHRDFKPDNVMISHDGRVRVMDFGLARGVGDAPDADTAADPGELESGRGGPLSTPVTRTGAILGTPAYMAPEQHRGEPTEPRSDQFSFCVALYEALYGERPFAGDTLAEISASVLSGRMREPRDSAVPSWLRKAVVRGLQLDARARWPSMDDLLAVLRSDPAAARKRWLAIGAAAAVAAAAVGGYAVMAGAPAVCRAADDKAAEVWSPERKRAIRAAFDRTGSPHAELAWAAVEPALDARAAAWVDMHTEACKATHVRGEQSAALLDRRMACLNHRLAELDALAGVLEMADADVVVAAIDAADQLTPLAGCADLDALSRRAELPRGVEPERVDRLTRELAHAKALRDAGKLHGGIRQARDLVVESSELGYAPLHAEALYLRAQLELDLELEGYGAGSYELALFEAEVAGDDELAARIASELIYVAGHKQLDRPRGHLYNRLAEAKIARLGGRRDDLHAARLHRYGALLTEQGDYAAALTTHRRALELRRRGAADAERDPGVAKSLAAIASVYSAQGRYDEALAHYDRARAIAERIYGADHPELIGVLNNQGLVLHALGRYDDALANYQRVQTIAEARVDADAPAVALALINIASVYQSQGELARAEDTARRALALYEQARGPHHPDVAAACNTLGVILARQGRLEEATAFFRRNLEINRAVYGDEHPSTVFATNNVGTALADRGLYAEALPYLRRALELKEQVLGPDHPSVAATLVVLARIELAGGRPVEAVGMCERAVRVREAALGADHPDLAEPLAVLGLALLADGAPADAVPHLERARALRGGAGDPVARAETAFALARALWDSGREFARARALAEEARALYLAAGDRARAELDAVEDWLRRHS